MAMGPSSSAFCSGGGDSFSSSLSYTPGTPRSPSYYGPMVVRPPPFFMDFGINGESYCCPSSPEYTPSSPSRRAGSPEHATSTALWLAPLMAPPLRAASPDYTPSTPPRRAASPEYTPSSPPHRAASLDYSPLTPPRRSSSPDYTPSTPPRRGVFPNYSPLSPPRRAASPDYTPLSPPRRAASPDCTPSTPPPSPLVSDAESRTSPRPRRYHPYQRSGASTCSSRASRFSRGRHHRAFLHGY